MADGRAETRHPIVDDAGVLGARDHVHELPVLYALSETRARPAELGEVSTLETVDEDRFYDAPAENGSGLPLLVTDESRQVIGVARQTVAELLVLDEREAVRRLGRELVLALAEVVVDRDQRRPLDAEPRIEKARRPLNVETHHLGAPLNLADLLARQVRSQEPNVYPLEKVKRVCDCASVMHVDRDLPVWVGAGKQRADRLANLGRQRVHGSGPAAHSTGLPLASTAAC